MRPPQTRQGLNVERRARHQSTDCPAHFPTHTTTMKFRKKPVVIEAFQMTKEARMDNSNWPDWLHAAWNKPRGETGALQRVDMFSPMPDLLEITTLEGRHFVSWNDWIIRGVNGELYPCKPDIFEKTYERVDG